MKRKDIQKCALCGDGVMHTGIPLFYTVKINRMAINPRAVQETAGLEMMLGSVQLAGAMGTDPDIASVVTEGKEVWVCENCVMENHCIAELAERFGSKE